MARAKSKLSKFTGSLAKPIKRPRLNPLASQEERDASFKDVFTQRFVKIGELMRFYGLSREKWGEAGTGELIAVILGMACDFVPGFQLDRVGRPPKHDVTSQHQLLLIIDVILAIGLADSD
jgi:hypothetical protein